MATIPSFIDKMYSGEKQTGFMKHYYTLYSIVEGLEAKETFEFGTGKSTEVILSAQWDIEGAHHTSCDVRELQDTGIVWGSGNIVTSCSVGNKYDFLQGDSRVIKIPEGPFDFVLHDGSHVPGIVLLDVKKIVKRMKKNSILLVHDTNNTKYKPSLETIVERALRDVYYESVTLPYGYGLTIIKILSDFGNGIVTPTWSKK